MADRALNPKRRSVFQIVVYASIWLFTLVALKSLFGLRRYGRRHIPKRGALLLVANHQSYLDPPAIGVCIHRQFHPVARAGLFHSAHFGGMIRMLNAIPIREDGRGDTAAMRTAIDLLNSGEVVLVFPEGSRSETGEIEEFKRGVSLLLKRTNCPVAPVAIDGAFEAWPRSRKRPKLFTRIGVLIGEPIAHEALLVDGAEPALERLRADVMRLRDELRAKLGRAPIRAVAE